METNYKKCSILLLATDKSNLFTRNGFLEQVTDGGDMIAQDLDGSTEWQPYELYIISDDEIKNGDNSFVYYKPESVAVLNDVYCQAPLKDCAKVIATTNTDLNLPQIPQDFIEEYIRSYNGNEIVKEVLIETQCLTSIRVVMLDLKTPFSELKQITEPKCIESKIKISPNNTISIKKTKDS